MATEAACAMDVMVRVVAPDRDFIQQRVAGTTNNKDAAMAARYLVGKDAII